MSERSRIRTSVRRRRPQRDNDDEQHVILNRVDDSVVADAHTKAGASLKCFRTRRSRVLAQESDCAADSIAMLVVDSFEGARRGGRHFNAIGHYQPRSALT